MKLWLKLRPSLLKEAPEILIVFRFPGVNAWAREMTRSHSPCTYLLFAGALSVSIANVCPLPQELCSYFFNESMITFLSTWVLASSKRLKHEGSATNVESCS